MKQTKTLIVDYNRNRDSITSIDVKITDTHGLQTKSYIYLLNDSTLKVITLSLFKFVSKALWKYLIMS